MHPSSLGHACNVRADIMKKINPPRAQSNVPTDTIIISKARFVKSLIPGGR
jgi:hypothetical protein